LVGGPLKNRGRKAPGVIGLPDVMGKGVEQDEVAHSLGVRVREADCARPAVSDSDQRRSLRTHGVEYGAQVGATFLVEAQRSTFRCAPTPGLEPDGTTESAQSVADPNEAGILPHEVDGDCESRNEENVEWPVSGDLIRNVGTVD
jgi:hypothetical protein